MDSECETCGKRFGSERACEQHHQDVHCTCELCGKRFASSTARNQHAEDVHKDRDCGACGKRFGSDEARDQHHRYVHMERECDICEKRFATPDARDQHRRDAHKTFGCTDCGKEFQSESSLGQHERAKHHPVVLNRPQSPPLPGLDGEWVERSDFCDTKSFGFFMCLSCSRGSSGWFSAHAFPNFKQGCKACGTEVLPQFLWQNASQGADREDTDKLQGPHQSDLCEACRAGVCVSRYTKF